MKSLALLTVLFFARFIHEAPAAAPFNPRSVSPSGQFVVYGSDIRLRGAISALAEQVKADLLQILQRRDDWKIPVVINLQSRAPNAPEVPATALRFSQTDAGPKLQLDLSVDEQIESNEMERELARAVLLEMIYRTQRGILAGQDYVEPPPWLIYGLLADRPHRDTTPLREALYVHGPFKSVGDFLNQRPELLDPSARLLYRAYSFAFVRWLIERGDGRARLARYIDNLASASNNGASDLRETFPELPPNGEEKWIGDVAEVARETQILSFSRSEEQLRELLAQPGTVRAEAESTRLDELCEKKLTRSRQVALQKLAKDLILLSERANPLLRPIVQRYQAIAVQLTLGKKRGAGAELRQLRDLRARLSARMSEVDDYLNWFEATQLNTASGLFEHDLESSEELKATSYRKKDALSLYLNAVEQEN